MLTITALSDTNIAGLTGSNQTAKIEKLEQRDAPHGTPDDAPACRIAGDPIVRANYGTLTSNDAFS
ncbi:MAG: hypothetical protein H6685_12895 [Deltaproteobacteria bacterium]|nr:hypothetical protein [Deltaproteobacteria bacterium]